MTQHDGMAHERRIEGTTHDLQIGAAHSDDRWRDGDLTWIWIDDDAARPETNVLGAADDQCRSTDLAARGRSSLSRNIVGCPVTKCVSDVIGFTESGG